MIVSWHQACDYLTSERRPTDNKERADGGLTLYETNAVPIHNLSKMFAPKQVAVLGTSARPGTIGQRVIKNMLQAGFGGGLYPVSDACESVHGMPTFLNVRALPEKPDLAVICNPAIEVPAIVRECGSAGIPSIIILSSGFSEVGDEGRRLENLLLVEAKQWPEMRILGPNSLGIVSPSNSLNASFAAGSPKPGRVAFISQSAALCASILDWSRSADVGFSHVVSLGNVVDIEFSDLIDYFSCDPCTSSLVLYVESIGKAREFMSAARAFTHSKPIIVYKPGQYSVDAATATCHAGSIVTVDAAYDAAFRRAGAVRVEHPEDMVDCAEVLSTQRLPKGSRLGIVTNAGGPGLMAMDELKKWHGELAKLSPETQNRLNEILPSYWSNGNPVNVFGDSDPRRYSRTVRALLDDPEVDGVVAILTPQLPTDPTGTAKRLANIAARSPKPILAAWLGGDSVAEGRQILAKARVATYESPDRAIRAFGYLCRYVRNREVLYETPHNAPAPAVIERVAATKLVSRLLKRSNKVLSETDAKFLLQAYGIPTTTPELARNQNDATTIANRLGYPVVLKVQSPDIVHKNDVAGVALGVNDDPTARRAYDKIITLVQLRQPGARIDGVTVQPMVNAPGGIELMVGMKRDPVFGPVLLVGVGGTAAEFLADIALELPPLNERLARRMLESLRIWPLLAGQRGRQAVNAESLIDVLIRLSYLIAEHPEIRELDVNPLYVTPEGVIALDASIVLDALQLSRSSRPFVDLAIRPYPEEFVREVQLRDGESLVLRPIKPEDEPLWHDLLRRTSRNSLWHRFRYSFKETTHELATRFCYVDYDRTMALVAEADFEGTKRLVAVARLVTDADHQCAEFAVLVEDEWQGKGLGKLLTQYCLEVAEAWGIRLLTAETTADNFPMQAIFRRLGFELAGLAGAHEWTYRKLIKRTVTKGAAADAELALATSAS
jgi:acetyltransferase